MVPVRGEIFPTELAHSRTRAHVPQCQGAVDLVFTQLPPNEFQRLQDLSDQREKQERDDTIIGFQGVGEGWIVENSAGEPTILLYGLDKVKEDPEVTELRARRTHHLLRR